MFVFGYAHVLYYKCHKINPNCCGSYVDSPYLIKNKKASVNPSTKKDNKCFQYGVTVALDRQGKGENPERITKIKPVINKYGWERVNFP